MRLELSSPFIAPVADNRSQVPGNTVHNGTASPLGPGAVDEAREVNLRLDLQQLFVKPLEGNSNDAGHVLDRVPEAGS
eukprot:754755-Hanusia_phi.AAC.3